MADEEQSLPLIGHNPRKSTTHSRLSLPLLLAGIVVLFTAALGAGIVIGWKLLGTTKIENQLQSQPDWGGTVNNGSHSVPVGDWLDEFISAQNIRENLK